MMNDTRKREIEQGKWEKQCKHLKRLLLAYKLRVVDLNKQNSALSKQNFALGSKNAALKSNIKSSMVTPGQCSEQGRIIRNDITISGGEVNSSKKVNVPPNAKGKSKRITEKGGKTCVSRSLTGNKRDNDLDISRKWQWTKSELENNKNELANCKQKLKEKENAVQLYVSGLARLNSIIDKRDIIIHNLRKENAELRKWVADANKNLGNGEMHGKLDNGPISF